MPRATVFAVLALAAVAALALPRPVRAQATRADSAAMLLDTAHRLDAQGSRAAASVHSVSTSVRATTSAVSAPPATP